MRKSARRRTCKKLLVVFDSCYFQKIVSLHTFSYKCIVGYFFHGLEYHMILSLIRIVFFICVWLDTFVGKYSIRSCELLPTSSIADQAWDRSNGVCNSMTFLDESIIWYLLDRRVYLGSFFKLDPVSMYVFILHKNNYVLILIKNVCTRTIITRVRSYSFGRYMYILTSM